ncbi:MAG: NAD(P)H-dependent oxidoreductase [Anaerolineae bacterium]
MIYSHLFSRMPDRRVRAALIGAGSFGRAIVTQAPLIRRLDLCAVADLRVESAVAAFRQAGYAADQIALCDSRGAALEALEAGQVVVVGDALLLMDLPLDVIASATRVPEAAALYAREAIGHGKHVVMIDKEADAVVGSILKRRADAAGVVYTTDDGDQPGLLMGLVAWARELGTEVLCGGDLRDALYDPASGTVSRGGRSVIVPERDRWALEPIPAGEAPRHVQARRELLAYLGEPDALGDPICHMVVAANNTGLLPETPIGHRATLRITEIPSAYCPVEDGGILGQRGVLDVAYALHAAHESHGGGGVFIVVANPDPVSRATMIDKGLYANPSGSAMLAYRPYHLCGAETAMSILCAGLLGVPTGSADLRPRVDMVATTTRPYAAGETISRPGGLSYDSDLNASLVGGGPLGLDRPVPFFMLEGARVKEGTPSGTTITGSMVEHSRHSVLWSLREEQDRVFFPQEANR